MKAQVQTYGGDYTPDGLQYVQHWQLIVDGVYISDTSTTDHRDLFYRIAQAINADDAKYEQGYKDGYSSSHADFDIALDDILPDDVPTTPEAVAAYIERLQGANDHLVENIATVEGQEVDMTGERPVTEDVTGLPDNMTGLFPVTEP